MFIYRCTQCGKEYARDEARYLCPVCSIGYKPGIPLPGVLEAVLDSERIRKAWDPSAPDWNLFSAVEPEFFPSYPMGQTPFSQSPRLGIELGLEDLWIKFDGLNPSGSLKDRASFLMVAEALRLGENRIVAASTGNAASALAAVCASTDRKALIFVPQAAPKAKLLQMILYGATVLPVKGTYDDAFRLSLEYTDRKGGLNRNTAYHPLTIEGKKTVGLEIYAQNRYRVPDAILVPTGDGVILAGVHKAFVDLKRAGLIAHLPRLICVQAETSDAIHRYWETGRYENVTATTRADSISVSCPSNAHWAVRALKETEGFSVRVSDEAILEAQARLAARTGMFAEPAAAATLAALQAIQASPNRLASSDQVVLLVTGHGLKDIEAPMGRLSMPEAIEPTLEAAEEALEKASS